MQILHFQNRHSRFLLLFVIGLILLISHSTVWAKNETNRSILVMGDSLSAAYGISSDKGWVALLANRLSSQSITIVNASLSGETSSGGLQRLPHLINKHRPKWMILELGANDALRGQSLKKTRNNLQKMISQCLENACQPLLLGIRLPTNYGPAYDRALQRMYKALAEQNDILLDPFFLEDVALDPELMQADGLHPNAKAQPIILERVVQRLNKLLD